MESLILLSLQDAWESLAAKPKVAGDAWGINAAVVGLLSSALYQPVFISVIVTPIDMACVTLSFFALRTMMVPIVMLVIGYGTIGLVSNL